LAIQDTGLYSARNTSKGALLGESAKVVSARASGLPVEGRFCSKLALTTENIELVLGNRLFRKTLAGTQALGDLCGERGGVLRGLLVRELDYVPRTKDNRARLKDLTRAVANRAEWRRDERRWCREGRHPRPGWWPMTEEGEVARG